MVCMLTKLVMVSSLVYPSTEWKPIRMYTTQKLVVPQEEYTVTYEKMLSKYIKKDVVEYVICSEEAVTGTTNTVLTLE